MEQNKIPSRSKYLAMAIIVLIISLAMLIFNYHNYRSASPLDITNPHNPSASPDQPTVVSPQLDAILDKAVTFEAVGPEFYGKMAPELVLTDIDGKTHKLSEWIGRDVLIVFWATWCPPCNMEIPHLIDLRNKYSPDVLEIIAISSEEGGQELLRSFAKDKGINYNVVWTEHSSLPVPFEYATRLPTAFFIDKQGKFKLITIGMVDGNITEAIINAPSVDISTE